MITLAYYLYDDFIHRISKRRSSWSIYSEILDSYPHQCLVIMMDHNDCWNWILETYSRTNREKKIEKNEKLILEIFFFHLQCLRHTDVTFQAWLFDWERKIWVKKKKRVSSKNEDISRGPWIFLVPRNEWWTLAMDYHHYHIINLSRWTSLSYREWEKTANENSNGLNQRRKKKIPTKILRSSYDDFDDFSAETKSQVESENQRF